MTSQGTKMPRANWEVLTEYPIVLPPSRLVERFNNLTQNTVEMIRNINLRKTRDLLLPKLISGELDVSTLTIGSDLYRSQEGEEFYAT